MMNERIQELARQAEKLTNEETKAFTDDTGQWRVIWNEVYDKKFAELIAKECAKVARNTDLEDVDGGDSAVLYAASEAIENYFGVK